MLFHFVSVCALVVFCAGFVVKCLLSSFLLVEVGLLPLSGLYLNMRKTEELCSGIGLRYLLTFRTTSCFHLNLPISTLNAKTASFSETAVIFYQIRWCHISTDTIFHSRIWDVRETLWACSICNIPASLLCFGILFIFGPSAFLLSLRANPLGKFVIWFTIPQNDNVNVGIRWAGAATKVRAVRSKDRRFIACTVKRFFSSVQYADPLCVPDLLYDGYLG